MRPVPDREGRGMLIETGSVKPGPVRGAVAFLEYFTFMWMTEMHKWL